MQAEAHAEGLEILINLLNRSEMVHVLFGETRSGLKSSGATAVTRAVAVIFRTSRVKFYELTILIDRNLNEALINRTTKEFRCTMTPMLLKEANLAERMFSLKFSSIRPKPDGFEALCQLADEDARKVVVQQAGLNQFGVFFIRYTRRADDTARDQNLPVVWLPESTSLKEALQRGSSLAGCTSLARKLMDNWECAFTLCVTPRF